MAKFAKFFTDPPKCLSLTVQLTYIIPHVFVEYSTADSWLQFGLGIFFNTRDKIIVTAIKMFNQQGTKGATLACKKVPLELF